MNSQKHSMRGLTVFVTDLRNAPSKEKEKKRVDKELAKIRKKFKEQKGVDGYNRRKYVAKILYMHMLGYEVDFGYMEAIALVSSNKYPEKQMGYISLGILLNESHEMVPLMVQSLQHDLESRSEHDQALALSAIANIGGSEMAEALSPIVFKLLVSTTTQSLIKKKASLCLLKLYRKYPDIITQDMAPEIVNLLDRFDIGLLTAVMSLLLELVSKDPEPYAEAVPKAVYLLQKIVVDQEYQKDYVYYTVACPWLQIKLLRLLKHYPTPDGSHAKKAYSGLPRIFEKIFSKGDQTRSSPINHKNAQNAVLFEAISLVVHLDINPDLLKQTAILLGKFISAKETNIRYLGLEFMAQLAIVSTDAASLIKKHQDTVIQSLKDADISIRRRALDLLYGMCDKANSKVILTELLNYLVVADFAIREELVLKIAILAEKFALNYGWYVDVILQLISLAGDNVSDDIWYRVVKIVVNNEDIQEYAAKICLEALKHPSCHETTVKVGGYILGEFGSLIANKGKSGPLEQFALLQSKFNANLVSLTTKALLLSTYVKFLNMYPDMPDLTKKINKVFKDNQTVIDAELQQRACEYFLLNKRGDDELLQTVLDAMPPYNDEGEDDYDVEGSEESSDGRNSPAQKMMRSPSPAANARAPSPSAGLIDLDVVEEPEARNGNNSPTNYNTTSTPVSTAATTTTATNGDLDIFGSDETKQGVYNNEDRSSDFFGQSAAPSPAATTMDPELVGKLVISKDGYLYEDDRIQVGIQSMYQGALGQMKFYYGNRTSQPLENFTVDLLPNQSLLFQLETLSGNSVLAESQSQQALKIMCSQPFAEAPQMKISFSYQGELVNLLLDMPITMNKFTSKLSLSGGEFFSKWKELSKPDSSEVFPAGKPIDIAFIEGIISEGLNLDVLSGVDQNPANIVAAGKFMSRGDEDGVELLMRLETNSNHNMYRLTVASADDVVVNGFVSLLKKQLA